jgi:hypothetical protein
MNYQFHGTPNLLRPLTWYSWLTGLAAGVVWLATWYAPVSIRLGVSLLLLVFFVLVSVAWKRNKGSS